MLTQSLNTGQHCELDDFARSNHAKTLMLTTVNFGVALPHSSSKFEAKNPILISSRSKFSLPTGDFCPDMT